MKGKRVPINKEIIAQLLYECDRTCCVCTIPGKEVQVHHIDEDRTNNDPKNLAVLCFDCHNKTQVTGGFGRKLNPAEVRLHKVNWLGRVVTRRNEADQMASRKSVLSSILEPDETEVTPVAELLDETELYWTTVSENERMEFERYINRVAEIKQTMIKYAKEQWESGVDWKIKAEAHRVTDFYREIMDELTEFYPPGHFHADPKRFLEERVADIAKWQWLLLEPFGKGTAGTMEQGFHAWAMMIEVETMLRRMVARLCELKMGLDYVKWEALWDGREYFSQQTTDQPQVTQKGNELVVNGGNVVAIPAEFPGGEQKWRTYLEQNVNLQVPISNGAMPGSYTVVVSFVIAATGSVEDVKALNDPGYGTAAEACRTVAQSQSWQPAQIDGEKVSYKLSQKITFNIEEE